MAEVRYDGAAAESKDESNFNKTSLSGVGVDACVKSEQRGMRQALESGPFRLLQRHCG